MIPKRSNVVKRVVLNISENCFFHCQMCFIWKNKQPNQKLDGSVYERFFRDLKKIKGPETDVTFTGGEPLLVPHVYNLLSLSTKNGFKTNLNTNGWLINDNVIRGLLKTKITDITFSLDGSSAKIHDKIRGVNGSFNRVIKNASKIKNTFNSKGLDLQVNAACVVSKLNLDDIVNLVNYVQNQKSISKLWFQTVTAPFFEPGIVEDKIVSDKKENTVYWFEHKKYKHLWPKNKEKLKAVYSELIYLKRKGYKISNTEKHLMLHYNYFINPKKRTDETMCDVTTDLNIDFQRGYVFQCLRRYNIDIGNILTEPIDQIWKSNNALSLRKKMMQCNAVCHEVMNCNKKLINKPL